MNNTPYIRPKTIMENRLQGNQIPQWDIAVMCFHGEKRSDMLISANKAKPLGYKVFDRGGTNDACECTINGKKVGFLRCCAGNGTTANNVEELAYLCVKCIIGYGAAASISADIKKGTQVIASDVLNTDGVGQVYCPNDRIIGADPWLVKLARNASKKMNFDVRCVRGATVDAFYRETENLIAPMRNSGGQILNIEIGPLYASAKVCKIPAVWVGHVSDRLLPEAGWEEWFSDRDLMHRQSVAFTKELLNEITLSL